MDHEIVWDTPLITRLAHEYGIRVEECDPDAPIVDERSLVAVILGHARARRGGERFVGSPGTIERFSARHRRNITIGGTCVRAALVMRTLGVRSTALLVAVDDTFLGLFPGDCDYLVGDESARLVPHLIVQLPESGSVPVVNGEVVIDGANRLIFVNDPAQAAMELSPDLDDTLAGADVFLVSGFNAMPDATLLQRRLESVIAAMESLPSTALVVYEDAGYHCADVGDVACEMIVPRAHVFSMNEDELQARLGHRIDLLDPQAISRALAELRGKFPGPTLVVHTRHWALASGERAAELEPALEAGIRAATARYLYGDDVTAADIAAVDRLVVPEQQQAVAAAIRETAPRDVRCVPAYEVHAAHPTTIGLGDCFVGGLLAELVSSVRAERTLR